MRNKRGQVWIETVIYTLIALIMIGAVLGWGKPKIEQLQDKAIIEQTIGIFEDIDSQILSAVQGGAGNKRTLEIGLKKGSIAIHAEEDVDAIFYEIETRHTYSEPGEYIHIGNVLARTVKKGEYNDVVLKIDYAGIYDLKFEGTNTQKTITKSSTPHKLTISNDGASATGLPIINMIVN